jgi:hypothetical protein
VESAEEASGEPADESTAQALAARRLQHVRQLYAGHAPLPRFLSIIG